MSQLVSSESETDILERLEYCIKKRELPVFCDSFSLGVVFAPVALDIEHDENGELVGIGVYNGISAEYWTVITPKIKTFLETQDFVAHNGKTDFECLRQWGVNISDSQLVWDTELMAHIIDSSRRGYGLKKLAREDLGIEYPDYDEIVGKHKGKCPRDKRCKCKRVTLDKQDIDIVSKYNALDCFATYKLYEHQRRLIY